jgi:hypothetical protein
VAIGGIPAARVAREVAEADARPIGRADGTAVPGVSRNGRDGAHVGAPIAGALQRRRHRDGPETATQVIQRDFYRRADSAIEGEAPCRRVDLRQVAVAADVEVAGRVRYAARSRSRGGSAL